MATHNVKNISTGIRGFYATTGLVELAKGATAEGVEISDAELRSAQRTGWFEIDGSTDAPSDEEAGPNADLAAADGKKLDEIAKAEGVDLSTVTGTGANGRVLLDDKRKAIADAREAKAAGSTGGEGGNELDAMDDATLLTTTAAITGTPEADLQGKPRDELLRLARGEA